MKKYFTVIVLSLLLYSCHNKKEQIVGVWKMDSMEVNGVKFEDNALGVWLWEFNDEGGFLRVLSGQKEKGTYKTAGKKLIMKSVTFKDQPEAEYEILKLDSVELELRTKGVQNESTVHFLRSKGGGKEEND